MTGTGSQASPAWQMVPNRRRKFVRETAEDPESEQTSDGSTETDAFQPDTSLSEEQSGASIDVLA